MTLRERVARRLYACEKARAERTAAIIAEATGSKASQTSAMEPWEECCEAFLSDADAVLQEVGMAG